MDVGFASTGIQNPTEHLPLEIISRIFCFSASGPQTVFDLPDADEASVNITGLGWYDSITTPQLLSSVCQEWRSIGHSIPELWTHVQIIATKWDTNRLSKGFIDTTTEEIERSGTLPLHIIVSARYAALTKWRRSGLVSIIDVLRSHNSRWKSLFIQIPPWNLDSFVPQFSQPPVCLERFRFRYEYYADSRGTVSLYNFAPIRLRLEGSRSRSINLTWTPLLELHLIDSDASTLLLILPFAPNIKQLLLRHVGQVKSEDPIPSPLYHSAISDLVVDDVDAGALGWMNLVLPSLTSLSVKHLRSTDDLSPFIKSSCCQLRSLEIISCGISVDNLATVLAATPSLERLHIEQSHEGDWRFLPLFALLYENGPKLLPELSELRYRTGGKIYDGPTPWHLLPLPGLGDRSNLRKIEIEAGFMKQKSGHNEHPYFSPQQLDQIDRSSFDLRVWDTCQSPKSDFIEDSRRFHGSRELETDSG